MARGLTKKQDEFVKEYLKCFNASKAARLAGYSLKSARQIGSENLTKPYLKAIIDADSQRRSREIKEYIRQRAMHMKRRFR